MVKVMKTWDTKTCIIDTESAKYYICCCNDCRRQRHEMRVQKEKEQAERNQRITDNLNQYWTDQLSASDKEIAVKMFTVREDIPN